MHKPGFYTPILNNNIIIIIIYSKYLLRRVGLFSKTHKQKCCLEMPNTFCATSSTYEADRHNTSSGAHTEHDILDIFSPIQLPCGRTIPNRLVKVHSKFFRNREFSDSYLSPFTFCRLMEVGGTIRTPHLILGRPTQCLPLRSLLTVGSWRMGYDSNR